MESPIASLRFLRFSFHDYYPAGGLSDLECHFSTLEEAMALECGRDHAEILDSWTGRVWEWHKSNGKVWYEPCPPDTTASAH